MFSGIRNSWALIKASAGVLRADKELIVFPIISGVVGLGVLASFILPSLLAGVFDSFLAGGIKGIGLLGGLFFYAIESFVVLFANSALIGADFQSGLDAVVLAGFGYSTPEEAFSHVTDQSGTATFSDQGTTIIFYGLSVSELSADDFVVVPAAEDTVLV